MLNKNRIQWIPGILMVIFIIAVLSSCVSKVTEPVTKDVYTECVQLNMVYEIEGTLGAAVLGTNEFGNEVLKFYTITDTGDLIERFEREDDRIDISGHPQIKIEYVLSGGDTLPSIINYTECY